jgi:hypothetical protein
MGNLRLDAFRDKPNLAATECLHQVLLNRQRQLIVDAISVAIDLAEDETDLICSEHDALIVSSAGKIRIPNDPIHGRTGYQARPWSLDISQAQKLG